MTEMRNRGMQDILIAGVDRLKGRLRRDQRGLPGNNGADLRSALVLNQKATNDSLYLVRRSLNYFASGRTARQSSPVSARSTARNSRNSRESPGGVRRDVGAPIGNLSGSTAPVDAHPGDAFAQMVRLQSVRRMTSCSVSRTSDRSTTIFFSRVFSSSSALTDASRPAASHPICLAGKPSTGRSTYPRALQLSYSPD